MTAKKPKTRQTEPQPSVEALTTQLETKQAELDLLKGIQDGLASGLDIDAIFEQAGERIVPLFPGKSVALYTYDPAENMGTAKFILEDGVRHYPPPFKSGPIAQKALATGTTLKISTRAEYDEMGAITVPGTSPSLSGVYSPLLVNGMPVGALNIESTSEEHAFDESDVMLVSTIAGSLSVALENARLFDQAQRSNKELSETLEQQSATSEILRVMARSQSEIQPVLEAVAENAARLCEADDVQIYRVEGDRLRQAAHFGPLPALEDGESLPLVPGLITGRAVLEQRTIHTHDSAQLSKEEFPESYKLQKRLKHRTVIVTPLVQEGQAMGAIVVRRNVVQPFTEAQVALLATFADQAAIAIENVRLFNETTRLLAETEERNAELAVINSMQDALAAQLDFQEIIDLVGERVGEIFEADVVGISLYNHETGMIEMPYIVDHGERFVHEPRPVFGTFKYLLEKTEPILIRTHAEFEKILAEIQGENLGGPTEDNSHIVVPMLSGSQVIGVVSVGKLPELAFDESDVRLLQTLANSMSVALQNARLFDETQRLLKETEQRAAELAIINTVQRALSAQLDIRGIYEAVGEKLREIFDTQVIAIYSIDLKNRVNTTEYAFEKGRQFESVSRPVGSLHDHLLSLNDTYVFNGNFPEFAAQFDDYHVSVGELPQSLVGVPVRLSGMPDIVLTLTLQDIDGSKTFTESDVRLLETLANSMSVALENVRLLKVTEQRAEELSIINGVQTALADKLDMQAIYDAIGSKLHEVFPEAQVVDILSYDAEKQLFLPRYVLERHERYEIEPWTVSGFRKHVVETGRTMVLNRDVGQIALEYDNTWIGGGEPAKSWIGVPLKHGKSVTGVISLQHLEKEDAFSESDVRLIETLAGSMGVALENARLFNETQRLLKVTEERNAELAVITSVQQGLASKLDMQSIYDLVGETIRDTFDAQVVVLRGYAQEQGVEIEHYVVEKGQRGEVPPYPFSPIAQTLIREKQVIIINSDFQQRVKELTGKDPLIPAGEMPRSAVFVPLFSRGEVTGSISLQNIDHENAFTDAEVRLLRTLAHAMSISLENARLFDETQRLLKETEQRAAELQIINSVQEALASKLEMQAIYELVGEKIREIFRADTTFIAFHDVANNQLVAPYYADKGMKSGLTTRTYGQGLAEHIIDGGAPLHFNTAEEMDASGAYHIASPGSTEDLNQSFLGVPIFRDGVPIGAASVQSYQAYAFDKNDLSLLQTLANSMSVALENARLFGETQRLLNETEQRAAELATINAVGQALAAEPELDALIQLIGDQICSMFSADIAYVALLDQRSNLINFPYTFGEKFDPLQLGEGLTSKIIQSGEPLLINEQMDKRREEMGVTLVGQRALSYLGVPIQIGGRTLGVISVQSTSIEGRFNEQDLRLLHTIAANVGSAIRNAQLFEEVKRQNEYYAAVIENSPAAIVLMDLETHVTGWNPAAEQLFGYTEQEALGRKVDDLVAKRGDLHDEAVRYSEQALSEKSVHLLAQRTRKDGSLVEVEVAGLPVIVDGVQVEFIAIYHDITELQRARKEAEEANQAKSAFLANMSHELRTPLNAIIGFTRIVRRKGEGLLPDKQVDNLDKVLVSADHLLNLINTILDIAKIEAGRMDVKPSSFELPGLIELITSTSQPLLQPGVVLRSEIPEELPAVFTDQEKVKQILLNLLSNAAKFTHAGQIMLAVRQADGFVQFDVQDTGIGISPEDLEKVFEEFQQADSSTTREYGGTGLGLAISRSLARLLGGELTATSSVGEGSTFSLSIPLRFGEPASPVRQEARKQQAPEPSGDSPLILAIDNDTNVHDLLKENLAEHGYEVIAVENGEEGVRLARELKPFAITLDIMMPGKDGWQVLHELKSDPATREIPVILLTIVDKQALGYQLGAADYLVKPLEEDALFQALDRIRLSRSQPGYRLLVVDDDPNIPELVRQLLEKTEFQISDALNGQAALEAIADAPPDVILLDLMMPTMDGFAFIEALREAGQRIPIIVLTSKTLTEADLQALEGSVARVIKKNGLDPERLMVELAETIEQFGGRITAG